MQSESASVRLSTEHKGRKRREPVWIGRYRIAGKDSAKVLGRAWTKRSRAPAGYLTRRTAEDDLARFLETEGANLVAAAGIAFGRAADRYLASLEARITSGSFRASTLRTYRNIIEAELRPRWGERPAATITRDEISTYRMTLVDRNLAAGTINQTRAIVRGIFACADLVDDPPSPSRGPRPVGRHRARSASTAPTRYSSSSPTRPTSKTRPST
jgi:hypothetical protein